MTSLNHFRLQYRGHCALKKNTTTSEFCAQMRIIVPDLTFNCATLKTVSHLLPVQHSFSQDGGIESATLHFNETLRLMISAIKNRCFMEDFRGVEGVGAAWTHQHRNRGSTARWNSQHGKREMISKQEPRVKISSVYRWDVGWHPSS